MAYQLANYTTDSGVSVPAAYLRITDVQVRHEDRTASVSFSIFVSKDAADTNKAPLLATGYVFADETDNLYTANFATTPGASSLGTPANVNDILQTQAYLALAKHPSTAALLSGAAAI